MDKKSTQAAYDAGYSFAYRLERRQLTVIDGTVRKATEMSKQYEDREAFMDGFWDGVKRDV